MKNMQAEEKLNRYSILYIWNKNKMIFSKIKEHSENKKMTFWKLKI